MVRDAHVRDDGVTGMAAGALQSPTASSQVAHEFSVNVLDLARQFVCFRKLAGYGKLAKRVLDVYDGKSATRTRCP